MANAKIVWDVSGVRIELSSDQVGTLTRILDDPDFSRFIGRLMAGTAGGSTEKPDVTQYFPPGKRSA